ncbi:Hypothetical protein ERS075564_01518 [Mycobacteroides abscessus]|uniref:Uncharacterized protein n=1 Tax=Mycobacteroides abscessus subsp. massiliense TaxID=1962118 RepID=A0AB38DHZ4_9MYCO|nr:hypothetical protein [Mycobacteroides abscessus]QSM01983.1 WXG motif protein [Mycobacterium phage prophi68-1]QSM05028.1 WXG motif protein [Mycobacterium phage prophiGD04-1]AMU25502.1 hypothetical protein A3N96_08830 [Mycobacteroides abscessus]AMU35228.1 hypothetical protein A3N98_08290 [Mycobacteroides abscessus]AMU40231.1 hypothetical protein A3N99_08620 [Mycobacteroides abscessus]
MGEYKFDINGMSQDARQEAAEAARTTLKFKDGYGMELAADMLRARDIIDKQLKLVTNSQDLSLGDLPSGREAAEHYKEQRQQAYAALVKIRDHYQGHADHFIATEMLFRNTEERNAGRINPYKDGTATVSY